jgi:hypothetical protein
MKLRTLIITVAAISLSFFLLSSQALAGDKDMMEKKVMEDVEMKSVDGMKKSMDSMKDEGTEEMGKKMDDGDMKKEMDSEAGGAMEKKIDTMKDKEKGGAMKSEMMDETKSGEKMMK